MIPRLRRSPGKGKGYPLQYPGLENSIEYSPWGHKELDLTEPLSLSFTLKLEKNYRRKIKYSWASLIAQLVKNLPAMQKTLVQFLGQEDPLEKGKATHSSILGLPLWLSW